MTFPCIFLMANDVEHLFMSLFSIYSFLSEISFMFFAHFLIRLFFILMNFERSYISYLQLLCQICGCLNF